MDSEKFTHWLPLYFGEKDIWEKKSQFFNEHSKQYENKVEKIDPRERMVHLLTKSICFITKKDTKKTLTPEMIIEVMPKLIITHLVDMVDEKKHISIQAIRRLINYIRLFKLLIELSPEVQKTIDERLKVFKEEPEKRIKDHCSSLGDILAFLTVSQKYKLTDLLDAYLGEQLDR